jgi:ABC-type histidine transport system ATPase subunit
MALPFVSRNGVKSAFEKAVHYLEKSGLTDWSSHLPNELSEVSNVWHCCDTLASEPKVHWLINRFRNLMKDGFN